MIDVIFKPTFVGNKSAALVELDAMGAKSVALTGSGAATSSTLSNLQPFAAQQIGTTSAAQTVTLTNSGVGPLAISSIAITGADAAEFAQATTCGASLAVGMSCTVEVTFAPRVAGVKSATLSVTDASGSKAVVLSGSGEAPSSTLTPNTSLMFAAQQIGTASTAQPVTLTNTGAGPLAIVSITRGGENPYQFAQSNNCGAILDAGTSCTIDVVFNPTGPGDKTATLIVVDAAGTKEVVLNGSGQTTFAATLSSAALSFAAQQVGVASAMQPVKLTNKGGLPFAITGISLGGSDAADFVQTNDCGASLVVGASCTINVAAMPVSVGGKSANLSVASAAGIKNVALSAIGAVPSSTLTPNMPLAFAAQQVGTGSAAQPMTLANTGVIPLPISKIGLGGVNPGQFAQTNNCGRSLPAGGSCTINVTFKPTFVGDKSATLTVADAASTQTIALSGSGQAALASTLSTARLAYAAQLTGVTSAAKSVTLTNTGALPLSIAGIAIGGANMSDFAQSNTCGASLAVGASCMIDVTFTPSAIGAESATLTVTDESGSKVVNLSGRGAALSSSLTPNAPLAFAVQKVGTISAAQAVRLTNTGGFSLAIGSIKLGGVNPGQFKLTKNCGASLPAGRSCTINVKYRPTFVGNKSATLEVVDAAGTQAIDVSAMGQ